MYVDYLLTVITVYTVDDKIALMMFYEKFNFILIFNTFYINFLYGCSILYLECLIRSL